MRGKFTWVTVRSFIVHLVSFIISPNPLMRITWVTVRTFTIPPNNLVRGKFTRVIVWCFDAHWKEIYLIYSAKFASVSPHYLLWWEFTRVNSYPGNVSLHPNLHLNYSTQSYSFSLWLIYLTTHLLRDYFSSPSNVFPINPTHLLLSIHTQDFLPLNYTYL